MLIFEFPSIIICYPPLRTIISLRISKQEYTTDGKVVILLFSASKGMINADRLTFDVDIATTQEIIYASALQGFCAFDDFTSPIFQRGCAFS